MDYNQLLLTSSGGIAIEPMIEHTVIKFIPVRFNSLKPIVAWLVATAYSILQVAAQGGDWRQTVGDTIGTLVVMELKHQSPWRAQASETPASGLVTFTENPPATVTINGTGQNPAK